MQEDIFTAVQNELKDRPKRLTDTQMWLFVAVNTAGALIDSADKSVRVEDIFAGCKRTREIQLHFDMIQGRYGRKFNSASNSTYGYLCSLVAFFDDTELSDEQISLISRFSKADRFLVYEL